MADALADVLRAKAEYKYAKEPEVIPTVTPVPSKSKTFAYTNIRLSTQATGAAPPPTLPPGTFLEAATNPFLTQQQGGGKVPVSGMRAPLVTQQAQVPPLAAAAPLQTQTAAAAAAAPNKELEAKLAEFQAQLKQLQELEEQLKVLKGPTATRRLLDAGTPGWDSGVLVEKVGLSL